MARDTLADVERMCAEAGTRLGVEVECRQTNHEGALVDWLQEAGREVAAGRMLGVVLNAGAYTHTSVALHDAIKGANVPVIELHISNVHARESFRHHSYISPAARGIIVGLGVKGYTLAIAALVPRLHFGVVRRASGHSPPRMSPGLRPPPLFRCGEHPTPCALGHALSEPLINSRSEALTPMGGLCFAK
jgi:3-dehydroquinate dehydratase-2